MLPEQQFAPRSKNSADFRQRLRGVQYRAKYERTDDGIELSVWKIECLGITIAEVELDAGRPVTDGALPHVRVRFDPNVLNVHGKMRPVGSDTVADFEDPPLRVANDTLAEPPFARTFVSGQPIPSSCESAMSSRCGHSSSRSLTEYVAPTKIPPNRGG